MSVTSGIAHHRFKGQLVIEEIIAAAGAVTAASVGLWGLSKKIAWEREKRAADKAREDAADARRDADQAHLELDLQREALSFGAFLEDWQNTSIEMSNLISDTEIDRILILRAWNGKHTPKWTTSFYQMREVGQVPRQYMHFELDEDYVDRLRKITTGTALCFTVDEIPDSFIRQVYEAEGVKASCWHHIETKTSAHGEAAVITYASFSSHSVDAISPKTQTECMLIAGRLKGLAAAFREEHAKP